MQKLTRIGGKHITVNSLQKAKDTALKDTIISGRKARETYETSETTPFIKILQSSINTGKIQTDIQTPQCVRVPQCE